MADRETWTSTSSPEPTLATGLDLGVPRGPVVYLLVLEGDTSTVFPLPVDGEVVIGRGDGVSLRLRDQSISRAHARVTCRGGQAEVADLGSQNGTRLNGDALIGTRKLVSGDAIAIGAITMVFHSTAKTRASRALISLEVLRQRLEEEVDRATRGGRSLAVIALVADAARRPGGVLDTVAIVRLADGQLRRADLIGQASAELFYALLPDVDAAGGKTAAGHLVRALYRDAPNIRAGVAACPADGIDVDALLAGARAAAEDAAAGEVALASTTYRTLDLGGRQAIVADAAMMRTFALVERLAKSDLSVLVCGETGTGKDVIASAVHHGSARARGPMVTLNCAAVPESLAESELFGHERGAFSGAVTAKLGILEAGHGGTVFLDEIGELPLAIQAKLLRALETRRITRVGDVASVESGSPSRAAAAASAWASASGVWVSPSVSIRGSTTGRGVEARARTSAIPGTASPSNSLARPKSSSLTSPVSASIALAGLMSRWSTPRRCAAASPRHRPIAIGNSCAIATGRRSLSRLWPRTNSDTRYGRPSSSPTRWTSTTLGCDSRAAARASIRNRWRATSLRWTAAMNFTATARSSRVSWARNTWPMPPRPSAWTSRYSSNCSGGTQADVAAPTAAIKPRAASRRQGAPRRQYAA